LPPVFEVAGNPSKVHKYCGLAPGSRRVRGKRLGYNPLLKTLCWKLMRQMLMMRARGFPCRYADQYEVVKAEYASRCPKPERGSWKLKVHYTAMRIVMRMFMTNFWLAYRSLHSLPVTVPYAARLGGEHKILKPEDFFDK
jgi:hypothetical protein